MTRDHLALWADRDTYYPSIGCYNKHWAILIQSRAPYNGKYRKGDWRAYRQWYVWPILFYTKNECEAFMEYCFTFEGLVGHKLSASATNMYKRQRIRK